MRIHSNDNLTKTMLYSDIHCRSGYFFYILKNYHLTFIIIFNSIKYA